MRHIRTILEVLLYVMVFLTIQLFVTYLVGGIQLYIDDVSLHDIAARAANGTMMPDATGMIINKANVTSNEFDSFLLSAAS